MSRNLHKYEELTPYEFAREKERASIIYLASGPLEFHEGCNAMGVDAFKGYDWCLAAAGITGGIVFPPVPIGPCTAPPRFEGDINFQERGGIRDVMSGKTHFRGRFGPPSLFTSYSVCHAFFSELLEAFAQDLKFKLCVFVGSHGPSGDLCRRIVRECGGTVSGMEVMPVGSLDYNRDVIQAYYAEKGVKRISHGGLWESAFNYAMNPDYFHPEYLDASEYPQSYGALTEEYYEGCIRPVLSEYRQLTPEFARELRRITVERLAEDVLKHYQKLEHSGRNAEKREG